MKTIKLFTLFFSFLIIAGSLFASQPIRITKLELGQPIPALQVTSMSGRPLLLSDLKGPVMITVFTTWCGVCRFELDQVNAAFLKAQKEGPGLSVMAVDAGEVQKKVEKYRDKKGLAFPVYLDPDLVFTKTLEIKGTPAILIFDASNKLVYQGNELPAHWTDLIKLKK